MINAYKILDRRLEEKRLVGGRRRRWEDNIRKDISESVGNLCIVFIWLRIVNSG
jgi:hypothetical protein